MRGRDPRRRLMAAHRAAVEAGAPLRRGGVLATALLVLAAGLSAQETSEDDPFRSWAEGGASWTLTEVADGGASLFGASLSFGLTPATVVGGAGFRLAGSTPTEPDDGSASPRLSFGYAGVVVERLRRLDPDWTIAGSVLVGAGHATVRSADATFELGADNFGVVQLQGGPEWRRAAPLRVSARVGYRFAFGVQDLPGVSAVDLRGFALTISLRLTNR